MARSLNVHVVELDYEEIMAETDKAKLILFELDPSDPDKDKEVWIPESEIHEIDKDNHTITISEWLAIEKLLV